VQNDTVFNEGDGAKIVETALKMENETYEKIEIDYATIYLYKCPVEPGAYRASANQDFFSDFYSDAADYFFPLLLADLREDVTLTDKISSMPIIGASCEHYKLYSKKFVGSSAQSTLSL
jgi:hypothetical protein